MLPFFLNSGFTIQRSFYDEAQEFNETGFLRTPDNYGFLTADFTVKKKLGIALTGNYTGKMYVPYFGLDQESPEDGELRVSNPFFDMGAKLRYTAKLYGARIKFYAGVKNIFNSYQNDFDSGVDRDPAYMYGPGLPRTIYFGVKIGNALNGS